MERPRRPRKEPENRETKWRALPSNLLEWWEIGHARAEREETETGLMLNHMLYSESLCQRVVPRVHISHPSNTFRRPFR